jgi:hypothetical protein
MLELVVHLEMDTSWLLLVLCVTFVEESREQP